MYYICTTPSQNTRGSKKELALESHLEKSRALVMLYTGADERCGSKLSSFIACGCIWRFHAPSRRQESMTKGPTVPRLD